MDRPLKPCATPRCPELTTATRCERHTRARNRGPDTRRGTKSERGYDSRWSRFSRSYRQRYPLCVECERNNRVTASAEVDHGVPLADGGEKYDEANLQALCKSCHSRKTLRETNAKQGGASLTGGVFDGGADQGRASRA